LVTASSDAPGQIEALLQGYSAAWATNQTNPIAALWWPERFRFYKAEEALHYFTRWEDLLAYWRGNEGLHELVDLRFGEFLHFPLSQDEYLSIAKMDWRIEFRAEAQTPDGAPFRHRGRAMAGFNHVLMLLRRQQEEWRFTGWSETPDAPPVYLTELYYRMAG
jgi:hypothetical protein